MLICIDEEQDISTAPMSEDEISLKNNGKPKFRKYS